MSDKFNFIKKILPECMKKLLRKVRIIVKRITEFPTICIQPYRHKRALEKLRVKSVNHKVKVAFLAIHSAVWKYDGVYKLFEQDERFEPLVVVCPVVNYGKENMIIEMEKTYNLFQKKGYNVIKTYNEENDLYLNVKKEIEPDIIFFTNPHRGLVKDDYYITNFKDVLSCYTQYAFQLTHLNEPQYNQLFHNILWKAFYETNTHKKLAKQFARNRGRNVTVSGYPGIDDYIYRVRTGNNVWKNTDVGLKRIIWAPHQTIDNRENLNLSTFLRYHKVMLDIVEKYKDNIQIAFKPHPLLKVKLIGHEEWGQLRTEAYYQIWKNLENGQLETDDYVDLFNTSDAMILDSASFVAEYLCCGKPSLFLFSDLSVKERFNEFGKLALEQHYHAFNKKHIFEFIDNVVLDEKDIKKDDREVFYYDYLIPPNNKKASENIYDEIINAIWS